MTTSLLKENYAEHFKKAPGMYAACCAGSVPETTRVVAAWATVDAGLVHFVVSDPYSVRFLENVRVAQRASLVAVTLGDFEAYQYKGEIVQCAPADAAALAAVDQYVEDFCALVAHVGIDPLRYPVGFVSGPYTTVTLKVDVIFDQTPRVGAGAVIDKTEVA